MPSNKKKYLITPPVYISIELEKENWKLLDKVSEYRWVLDNIVVELHPTDNGYVTSLSSELPVSRLQLSWYNNLPKDGLILGDTFERSYGDLAFSPQRSDSFYSWYFIASSQEEHSCFGVATQPNSLVSWTINSQTIDLWLDVRNGSDPLSLGSRVLDVATVIIKKYSQTTSFDAAKLFCADLAKSQKISDEKIIGMNDWYYAYGDNDKELILDNANFLSRLLKEKSYRPWVIIDDGWQVDHSESYNGGPWHAANEKFGDMSILVNQINQLNVRCGIWFRPLLTNTHPVTEELLRESADGLILDPSHPNVLQKIRGDLQRFKDWGIELVKHDFSTIDIFGCWGNQMTINYFTEDLHFFDKSKTTAEIINEFYRTIKEASTDMKIIGCNTISHLAAGVVDIQRIGDDTSGKDFSRTRKYGVNTLAFRSPQHQQFYQVDADCIGITKHIPWDINKNWLALLAISNTPLLISCNPNELSDEIIDDIKKAIYFSLENTNNAEPLNWLYENYPSTWQVGSLSHKFHWYNEPRKFDVL
ncbi:MULTISPECIES: hypothetical protein [Enterococcus]|uniref:hypothetical protein n=1 Tax=Enterococcus TaxID=1350 RepID=UPI0035669856